MEKKELKILIADDSSTVRRFIHSAISSFDWPITLSEAENGKQCFNSLLKIQPHIAFIDVNMPGLSGFQALGTAQFRGIKTYAVFMSTADSRHNIETGGKLNAHNFLSKPFTKEILHDEIRSYLRMCAISHVIVIDDSSYVRKVVRRVLEKSHFKLEIEDAENGEEALSKYGEKHYDIAFVDLEMPGMNGTEVIHKIRELHPQARFIMMSALDKMRLSAAAKEAKVDITLHKPFYQKDLDAAMQELYHLRHSRYDENTEKKTNGHTDDDQDDAKTILVD